MPRFYAVIILAWVAGIVTVLRAEFFRTYDHEYWKNKYEQSQWRLPMSSRTLGDSGLFLYEGVILSRGADVSFYNPEVPPLGKYAIGLLTSATGRPAFFGLISTALMIILHAALSRRLIPRPEYAAFATLLALTDPLVTSQWTATMLDSLNSAFMLGFFILLLMLNHPKARGSLVACGLGLLLGMGSQIKFPIFAPLLFALGTVFLWRTASPARRYAAYVLSVGIGYVLPYATYFASGHSVREFLGLQKGMLAFYLSSGLTGHPASAVSTVFAHRFYDFFSQAWVAPSEWSIVWPAIGIMTIAAVSGFRRNGRAPWIAALAVTAYGMIMLSVIPFWTRYLLSILPFAYFFAGAFLSGIRYAPVRYAVGAALLAGNVFASYPIVFPTPERTLSHFAYNLANGFFPDIYQYAEPSTIGISRFDFDRYAKRVWADAEIEHVTARFGSIPKQRFAKSVTAELTVTYVTRNLGSFSNTVPVSVTNANGSWTVSWSWDMLLPAFSYGYSVRTRVDPAKRGTIRDKTGRIRAFDSPSALVWVIPQRISGSREPELLSLIAASLATPIPEVRIHHRYTGNTLSDLPVPVGVISPDRPDTKKLEQFPGISLTPAFVRMSDGTGPVGAVGNLVYEECCSYLYNTALYDGTSGAEKEANSRLKGINGGELAIVDRYGQTIRTLLHREKKDGGTWTMSDTE